MMKDINFTETVKSIRNRTTRLDHEGDYWTEYEKEKLKNRFHEGAGITEIAIEMQRTEPAVIQQIEKMDLYQRKENPTRLRFSGKEPHCLCKDCKQPQSSCPRCNAVSEKREDG